MADKTPSPSPRRDFLKRALATGLAIGTVKSAPALDQTDLHEMPGALTPEELSIAVDEAFRGPHVSEALRDVHFEKLGRSENKSSPEIVLWEAIPNDRLYFLLKPPPGSINIYWSHSGSTLINELKKAYIARDKNALELLSPPLVAAWKKRRVRSIPQAAKLAIEAPLVFDIRYGGKTLAESLWIPEDGCGTLTLPYNGGTLQLEDFSVVSYLSRSAQEQSPDVLIVVAPPVLTDLETQALQAIPSQFSEMLIGASPVACTVLVTIVVFVALVTVVTTCCQPFHDKLAELELTDQSLQEFGPMLSLAKLLEVRGKIFEEFNVR